VAARRHRLHKSLKAIRYLANAKNGVNYVQA